MASGNQKQNQTMIEARDKHSQAEYRELAVKGTQKAKECIDFLKFSEGLVRRDIDLIRMQLEIKLKKLESRLQAELRNIVETETAKLEKFMEEAKTITESNTFSISPERLSSLKTFVDGMERKRLKFESNAILERSLDEITSFGKIVVEKIDSEKSNTVCKLNNNKGNNVLPNGYKRTFSDSSQELSSRLKNPPISSQQKNIQLHSSSNDTKANLVEQKGNRKDRNELESISEKTASNRYVENDNQNKVINTKSNKCDEHTDLDQQVTRKVTSHAECKRSDVKDSAETKVTEWMHADPMSVLRALKQQTSRSEENLKALRDMTSDNKSKTVLTNNSQILDKNRGATEYNACTVSTTNDSNSSTCKTNKRKTFHQTEQNDEVFKADGLLVDADEYSQMDKVSRANEIWFGRDRRRRREDFSYRRTRSLSPKTVRFRLEDPPKVLHERISSTEPEYDKILNNGNIPNAYKSTPIRNTGDVYFDDNKNDTYPFEYNVKQENKSTNNHINKLSPTLPLHKTEVLHTDTEKHKTIKNHNGKSGGCETNVDSCAQYGDTRLFSVAMYNGDSHLSKQYAPKEGMNIEYDCQSTQNPNTNYNNSVSLNRACTPNKQEERRQKLRDKRKRNNTISVITASDIAKINSKESNEFVTVGDITKISSKESNEYSTASGIAKISSKENNEYSGVSNIEKLCLKANNGGGIEDVFAEMNNGIGNDISVECDDSDSIFLTNNRTSFLRALNDLKSCSRPRIRSEVSAVSYDFAENDFGRNSDLLTQPDIRLSYRIQNSNVHKSKLDRQKLPSFREMLFSD